MGLSTRIITSDFPVEMQVDERLYRIDRNKGLFAAPRAHMLLFFLDVDHEVEVAGEEGVWLLRPNDACLLPANWARTYRPRQRGKLSRMHVLRVIWHYAEELGLPTVDHFFEGPEVRSVALRRGGESAGKGARRKMLKSGAQPVGESELMHQFRMRSDFTFEFGPDGLSFLREFTRKPRYLPGALTPVLHERIRDIRHEFDERPRGYKLRIAAMMLEVAVLCARVADRMEPAAGGSERAAPALIRRSDIVMRRIKEFLFENHRRALTLDEIAWHLKLSPEHVSRTFRQAAGMTVFDYLRFVRVDVAQQLLADSSRTVADVGRTVGFSNPTLFGRAFKRETGMTPQAYRQRSLTETHFQPSVQV